jgi:hypothetical protein
MELCGGGRAPEASRAFAMQGSAQEPNRKVEAGGGDWANGANGGSNYRQKENKRIHLAIVAS